MSVYQIERGDLKRLIREAVRYGEDIGIAKYRGEEGWQEYKAKAELTLWTNLMETAFPVKEDMLGKNVY